MDIEKSLLEAFVAKGPDWTNAHKQMVALLELSKKSENPQFSTNVILDDGFQHREEWEEDEEPVPPAVFVEIVLLMEDVLERVENVTPGPRILPTRRTECFAPSELPSIADVLVKAGEFEEAAGEYMDRYHDELESLLDEIATNRQRRDALFALLPKTEA